MAPVKKPPHQLQHTFLREWRDSVGMSQEAAAEKLDISRSLLSKIERAKSPYGQPVLERAADAYGCSVVDLLVRNPQIDDPIWVIHDLLLKAPPGVLDDIRTMAEALIRKKADAA